MTAPRNIPLQLDPQSGLLAACRLVRSPNCHQRPPGAQIDALVIHAISLPEGEYGNDYIAQFFTNRLDCAAHPAFAELQDCKVSAHFLLTRNGELIQFVPTDLCAWHAGESKLGDAENVNDFSIGIELEGCDADSFAAAQYGALINLATALMNAYPAIKPQRIVGHSDIAPGRKTDPGPHFDWRRLQQAFQPA